MIWVQNKPLSCLMSKRSQCIISDPRYVILYVIFNGQQQGLDRVLKYKDYGYTMRGIEFLRNSIVRMCDLMVFRSILFDCKLKYQVY